MAAAPAVDCRTVARDLGLQHAAKRWGPCPLCRRARSKHDRRLPVIVSAREWRCMICKEGGDAVALVSASRYGTTRPVGRLYPEVAAYLEALAGIGPPLEEQEAPERIDPWPALRSATPLADARDEALGEWLLERGIERTAPAGWLPKFSAPWWPGFSANWPVVLPACSGAGEVQSMHGVAISDAAPQKTCWPRGASSRELLFADRHARAWLRGEGARPRRVLFVEGATDYLSASTRVEKDTLVFGVFSGAFRALRLQKWDGIDCVILTDADAAGDRYATLIAKGVAPQPCLRVDWDALR